MGGFGNIARAFVSRNCRLFAAGNAISLIGTWLQRVAVGWLAWQLTHSGTWLGLVAFADLFPTVVLSPWAGALADRRDRVRDDIRHADGNFAAAMVEGYVYAARHPGIGAMRCSWRPPRSARAASSSCCPASPTACSGAVRRRSPG
ncbi:MAG TPA: MFS transporter [Stellaceae bacterium]|nr:MFS transporter [Stellaceae bacterium]